LKELCGSENRTKPNPPPFRGSFDPYLRVLPVILTCIAGTKIQKAVIGADRSTLKDIIFAGINRGKRTFTLFSPWLDRRT